MGKVNLAVEGYKLRQTGERVQKILDAVELLNMTDTKELLELPSGGTWHYGTELTHTQETVQNNSIKAVKGDFYLNTEHFHVYYTQNGTGDWIYIGNLRGSVDTSKWASINSPNFTGTPTAPTPSTTNNSTQIATTEFVRDTLFGMVTMYLPLSIAIAAKR